MITAQKEDKTEKDAQRAILGWSRRMDWPRVAHTAGAAKASTRLIQGLCCNSEDNFFPKISAKTLLTNPEHTGKYSDE